MSWYDFTKKGIEALAKMPQAELMDNYIETSKENLKLQFRIEELEKENRLLREQEDIKSKIERTTDGYFTLKGENPSIRYCTHCWDAKHLTIQVGEDRTPGSFFCPECHFKGVYDKARYDKYREEHQSVAFVPIKNPHIW